MSKVGDGECAIFEHGKLRCESQREAGPRLLKKPVRALASSQFPVWTARCALLADQNVACWGCCPMPWCYSLGLDRNLGLGPPPVEPVRALPLRHVDQVALSMTGACALLESGEAWCWGAGFWGDGRTTTNDGICRAEGDDAPRRLEQFPPLSRLALALDGRLCGVTPRGEVYCQGAWYSSDERTWLEAHPERKLDEAALHRVAVPPAREIAAGEHHFCALGRDGSVSCWGDNTFEQAGAPRTSCVVPGQFICRVGPSRVALPAAARAIALGAEHSCALLENGRVSCWGRNQHGALGFSSTERCEPCWKGFCDRVPGMVTGVDDIVEIYASRSSHRNWALTAGGELLTWPAPSARSFEPRPECPCDEHEPTLSSEQAVLRAREAERKKIHDLGGNHVRVRGHVSTVSLRGHEFSTVGDLVVVPLTIEPVDDQEVVVTGTVKKFRVEPDADEVWSLAALTVCGLPPAR